MRSNDERRSRKARALDGAAGSREPPSNAGAVEERMWWPRTENALTWGTVRFDENLNELRDGRGDVWLEVCLIREEGQPENLATLEIRTRLAVTDTRLSGESVVQKIKKLQRKLTGRWQIEVPEAGSVHPYIVFFDPPAVVRAYGRRSVVALQNEAMDVLQSLVFVGSMWRECLDARDPFSANTVYLLTLNVAEKNDWQNLFRGPEGRGDQVRPVLDLEMVVAVGRQLGFNMSNEGKVTSRPQQVGGSNEMRLRMAGLVAQELARRHNRKAVTIRRDVINPIVRGSIAGTLHMMTEKQVRTLRRHLSLLRSQRQSELRRRK
jgi:hypothetical protein